MLDPLESTDDGQVRAEMLRQLDEAEAAGDDDSLTPLRDLAYLATGEFDCAEDFLPGHQP